MLKRVHVLVHVRVHTCTCRYMYMYLTTKFFVSLFAIYLETGCDEPNRANYVRNDQIRSTPQLSTDTSRLSQTGVVIAADEIPNGIASLNVDLGGLFEISQVILGQEVAQSAAAPGRVRLEFSADGNEVVHTVDWQSVSFDVAGLMDIAIDVTTARYVTIQVEQAAGGNGMGFRWDVVGCPFVGEWAEFSSPHVVLLCSC